MSVKVHHGDSRDVLRTLADCSIDSVVTDPPYALVSITKRFGADNAAPCKAGKTGAYQRASSGFMGKRWDTGETAFDPDFWREVWRVMKPGAHLAAFGGTRSYHRLACAIEDAGFEIRDMVSWNFGSGFPKSHDVSKGIDKAAGAKRRIVDSKVGRPGYSLEADKGRGVYSAAGRSSDVECTVTAPATDKAAQWEGWGTALKPAFEPICLARKPLSEKTVAANVLRWGTGALNIDASRVEGAFESGWSKSGSRASANGSMSGPNYERAARPDSAVGRWPANVCHDGSEEVLAAFPDSDSSRSTVTSKPGSVYGNGAGLPSHTGEYGFDDSGSAARFFYSSKADAEDRLGSKHPTVKPVDLMRWLCTLITPPRGTILDPFAGTGTTGLAAMGAGFNAILIEREAEYVADIARRIAWAKGEGRLTAQETTRKATPSDHGPLFSMAAE